MRDPDLSGIDPMRRAEARRRIAILDDYLAIQNPAHSQTEAAARKMGVKLSRFYEIVQRWRIRRDPALVGVGRRGYKASRSDGLTDIVKAIIQDAIEHLGADVPHLDIVREVSKRCADAGQNAPSIGAIWTYVMDSRSVRPLESPIDADLVIGRVGVKVPISAGDALHYPEVAIAAFIPTKEIVGVHIACEPGVRANVALCLASAYARLHKDAEAPVLIIDDVELSAVIPVHLARFGSEPRRKNGSPRAMFSRMFGRTLGGARIFYRAQRSSPAKLTAARSASPLERQDAVAMILEAIVQHNQGVTANRPVDASHRPGGG